MMYFSTTWRVAGLLALAGAAHAQAPSFAPVATYGSGGANPYSLAVADVNGDGKLDLLPANTYSSMVGVLLGNGNGTFQPAQIYDTGSGTSPLGIVATDVNNDRKLDLVFANMAGLGSVGVLLGNGNGTFQAVTHYKTSPGAFPYDLAVADLNGDGQPDLLTSNYNGTNLTSVVGVFLGNGNGTFQAMRTFSSGNAFGIAVADVNGDGRPDVLTANLMAGTAGVLLGNGDGTLQAETAYSTGSGSTPYDVAVADVNGDGKPDLLTANYGTHTAGVLLGAGNGTFGPVTTYSTGRNSAPASLVVADLNKDGRPDLLTANFGGNAAGVLLGNGDGTFQAVATYSTDSSPGQLSSPNEIVVADVNRDGKPDLLTANYNDSQVGVLLNATLLAARAPLPGASASLMPNPAADHATLALAGLPATVAQVQATLLDATGRPVRQQTLPARLGEARAELVTASLATGLYLLHLTAYDARGEQIGSLLTQRLSVR